MKQARVFCIAASAAMAFAYSGCSDVSNREDFASQLKNKTEDEVIKYAGKPASVDKTDPAHVMWVYKSRTFDVPTRKTDAETDVIFTTGGDGKLHVADVVFK
jgi:hypothetical protein